LTSSPGIVVLYDRINVHVVQDGDASAATTDPSVELVAASVDIEGEVPVPKELPVAGLVDRLGVVCVVLVDVELVLVGGEPALGLLAPVEPLGAPVGLDDVPLMAPAAPWSSFGTSPGSAAQAMKIAMGASKASCV
jgi:hypothetical protein